ncbi:restriction endonuclease subunit S [Clostridium luticellarii]|jgi:type I restriction enzyme S subunit|uniref:restriction endonuclease subunit S n=1 Tax=Clostridium luticellarii TaxID=1691940 RepID=UPI0023579DB6|nr:restriction endonuclease subunit S [Clostridium luticellarii]MCI1944557.1 restriction endonuclease subunit S [Clostridium luticellarii]MCI1968056.1 restriction endonuclease subunit S [Clostridium luticellarii]MCI1996695.1 restriction endonuclease subunit S [Clostridium luticellarii]MCI2040932.1 restriction endonuclease subunit S [Clostridium luticellarii]
MQNSWRKVKLGSICFKVSRGGAVKDTGKIYGKSGVPFVRSRNIGRDVFNYEELVFIEYNAAERMKTVKLEEGDILINMRANSNLRFTLVPEDIVGGRVNQHVSVIRVRKNIMNPLFLKYFLMWDETQNKLLSMIRKKSTANLITKGIIENLKVYLPPMGQQEKIISMLCPLDSRIKINHDMNKIMSEIAYTIFQYWFVDFGPFKKEEFEETEFGSIPRGWKVEKMKDIVHVTDGTHESPKRKEKGYKLITSRNIKNNGIQFKNVKLISREDFREINRRSRVEKFDILITMIGTIGNTLLVQDKYIDYAIKNIGLIKTSAAEEMSAFIFLYLSSDKMKNYIRARVMGKSQKYISLGELRNIPVIIPPDNVIMKFNKLVLKLYEKMAENNSMCSDLVNIRNIYLSELISGKMLLEDII